MRDIRRLDVPTLATTLDEQLVKESETLDTTDDLGVHQQNRSKLHLLLARLTDYVEVASGAASRYNDCVNYPTGVRYEVEHIWANHADRHRSEFQQEADFARHRNLIGDLVLLPKSFNASYNDDPYAKKLPHYFKQNLPAASLNPLSYEKNPGFVRFVRDSGLPFRPYDDFLAADIIERGELYREIAKRVWNPEDLLAVAGQA